MSETLSDEQVVRQKWPEAHCAPYANANYPQFYCIRGARKEWTLTIGEGPTPEKAWANARASLEAKPVAPKPQEERLQTQGATDLPPLDVTEEEKLRASRLKGIEIITHDALAEAFRELASNYYCRERQLREALRSAALHESPNMQQVEPQTGLDKVTDARNDLVAMDIPSPECSGMRDRVVMVLDILVQVLIEHFPLMAESQSAALHESKEEK